MTTPPPPLYDTGNTMIAPVPVQLHTGDISGPAGKLGVVTIRTATTTLTVFLQPGELREWSQMLAGLADSMASGLTVASAADVMAFQKLPRKP